MPIRNVFLPLLIFFFLWHTIRWIRHLLRHKSFSCITFDEYCCNIHLLAAWAIILSFMIITRGQHYRDSNFSGTFIISLNYIITVITVTFIVSYARINRRQLDLQQINNELEMKSSFVRYVSHEIRTPLNTLLMGLKFLGSEMDKSGHHADWRDVVEDLETSCDTAVEILNNLLTYEKLTTNILVLDKKYIPVRPFLDRCVHPFLVEARAAEVDLRLIYLDDLILPDNCVQILVDKSKISQVLRNLLSNALKFSKSGSIVTMQVSVFKRRVDSVLTEQGIGQPCPTTPHKAFLSSSLFRAIKMSSRSLYGRSEEGLIENVLRIEVLDSGPGISEENQKRLFKEIVQFNPGELQDGKGSGLGLWISHQIVTLHKGVLSVYSEGLGHGSTFTLELPISEEESKVQINPRPKPQSINQEVDTSSVKEFESPELSLVTGGNGRVRSNKIASEMHIENPSHSPTIQPIPFTGDQSGLMEQTSHSSSRKDRRSLLHRARVLMVDDALLNRKMMRRVLQQLWRDVSEAADGQLAIIAVQDAEKEGNPFDVILMDYQMPNMDGPTAAYTLRKMKFKGKIIGVTGNALPADIENFMSHGADTVLIKPLQVDVLKSYLQYDDVDVQSS